jgi:hypothetical protein
MFLHVFVYLYSLLYDNKDTLHITLLVLLNYPPTGYEPYCDAKMSSKVMIEKLNADNYLEWLYQIESTLLSKGLMRIVDGTEKAPTEVNDLAKKLEEFNRRQDRVREGCQERLKRFRKLLVFIKFFFIKNLSKK